MKLLITRRKVLRGVSSLMIVLFTILSFFGEEMLIFKLNLAVIAGCSVLAFYPRIMDDSAGTLRNAIFCFVVLLSLRVLSFFYCSVYLWLVLAIVLLPSFRLVLLMITGLSNMKTLFRQQAPLEFAQTMSSFALLSVLALAAFLTVSFRSGTLWELLIAMALSLALYVLMYWSAWTNRVILMNEEKERALHDIIKGNLRTLPQIANGEDARMSALYSRLTELMEQKKPFLDESFTMTELAALTFTNKCYLSRTINYFSGKNYKQYMNYYRVKYSIELMNKDPHLKVMELASLSGFHSVVSYNMAFRMYVDDTPASYRKQIQVIKKFPSKSKGPVL